MPDLATQELRVPVEHVTLNAALVAETIAKMLEAEERMAIFNGRQDTPTSAALFMAASKLFDAAFTVGDDARVSLWEQITDLAEAES
jgi:hypothetical protein